MSGYIHGVGPCHHVYGIRKGCYSLYLRFGIVLLPVSFIAPKPG